MFQSRAIVPASVLALFLAAGVAGCKGGVADALDPGEEATLTFLDSDYETSELAGVVDLGFSIDDLVAALPLNSAPYDFETFGSRWIGARINVPDDVERVLVAAVPAANARDYLIVCRSEATGTLVGKDDADWMQCRAPKPAVCLSPAVCDATVELTEPGVHICVFAVSPLVTECYETHEPVGGDITIRVTSS